MRGKLAKMMRRAVYNAPKMAKRPEVAYDVNYVPVTYTRDIVGHNSDGSRQYSWSRSKGVPRVMIPMCKRSRYQALKREVLAVKRGH